MFIEEDEKVIEPIVEDNAQGIEPEKQKEIVTTKVTTNKNDSPIAVNEYKKSPFTAEMEAAAMKAAEESSAFQSLMNKRNERMKVHGERATNAEKATKALAWTNLITNLAKLAGWGYAPVVKEDTSFLTDAFAKADALRNTYYNQGEKYEDMLEKYKTSYVDAARKAHQKTEEEKYKAAGEEAKAKNQLAKENTTTTTTTTEVNPYKEAENIRKGEMHVVNKNKGEAQTEAAKAQAAAANARAEAAADKAKGDKVIYVYANPKDGNSYQITKSDARVIRQMLIDTLNDKNDINEESSLLRKSIAMRKAKEELKDDIAMITEAFEYGSQDSALADVVNKYLTRYPDMFSEILKRSKRQKTHQNAEEIQFTPAQTGAKTEKGNIDQLIK